MVGLPIRPASWSRAETSPAVAPFGISTVTLPLAVPPGVSP
jgi:hypothetical protein